MGFGSVSLYVFITGVNTTYLGIVWKYSDSYVINAGIISLISLFSSIIFFTNCWLMIKHRYFYKFSGFVAALILIMSSFILFLFGGTLPISFEYLLILFIPAFILMIIMGFLWKKLD